MDEDVVTAYYKQVQGAQYSKQAGGYYFPCKTPLLDVEIFITDQYHAVVPASLIRGPRLTSNTNLATPTDETCKSSATSLSLKELDYSFGVN